METGEGGGYLEEEEEGDGKQESFQNQDGEVERENGERGAWLWMCSGDGPHSEGEL